MTYAQLVQAVYVETNRPDLVQETAQAVLSAIQSVHCTDYYNRDLQSVLITFPTSDYLQVLAASSLPNYRQIQSIRKTDQTTLFTEPTAPDPTNPLGFYGSGSNGVYSAPFNRNYLQKVGVEDIIDNYGCEKTDVFYVAGTSINIRSSCQFTTCFAQYYAYPFVGTLANNYTDMSSWVANELPYAIVYKAAASIFAKIGEDKMIKQYLDPATGMYWEQLNLVRMTLTGDAP